MKKILFDFFPLALFFIAYRYSGIYAATAMAISASIAQLVWLKLTSQPIEGMHWINFSVIVICGGATLWLHNDTFIRWKPTALYWLFAGILTMGRWVLGRNMMRNLLSSKINLTPVGWEKLNTSWILFLFIGGLLNLYVAFSGRFTEAEWVNFKVFGLMIFLLIFIIGQSIWLRDCMDTSENHSTPPSTSSKDEK